MLRELAQIILDFAGTVASFFFPSDAVNFDFIRMATALILMIIVALIIWGLPTLLHRK
ncbi:MULTISPECIES: hypothetical protein [unclassified Bartonella]|uniref:hypothetical protein n=1 Tax=unclassified Bartonella TaxID=2645622 RepID=UPI0015FBB657|nr:MULTISPECIES: hypothetical protein [unclassified Bartonella]UXN02765.1 hypothetical protein N6B01_09820 [Bartonella sp. HY406]UXN05730.1 hypothetical protein N6A79_10570 [Bartonella sp. HY761]